MALYERLVLREKIALRTHLNFLGLQRWNCTTRFQRFIGGIGLVTRANSHKRVLRFLGTRNSQASLCTSLACEFSTGCAKGRTGIRKHAIPNYCPLIFTRIFALACQASTQGPRVVLGNCQFRALPWGCVCVRSVACKASLCTCFATLAEFASTTQFVRK